MLFPSLFIKFPKITDVNDIEQAKLLFRLANTQFKKAMDYFVLDGYVTEHVQLRQDVSKLYKQLAFMESNGDRNFAMQDRRRDLLEPILSEINAKAYEIQVIELEVELSDIYSTLFDIKYEAIKVATKQPKKSEFEELNTLGFKSIHYSQHAVEVIMKREEKYDYV